MVLVIETDVLVLGTGGAGLRAAIEARDRGASVAAVSKAPAGMNNATVVSEGGSRAALGGHTPEEHVKETLEVGKGVNDRRLVEVLAKEGAGRLLELRRFGVEFRERFGGISIPGLPTLRGFGLTRPLVEYAQRQGVRFFENTIATRLLLDGGSAAGAVAFDVHSDRPIVFSAGSVVLATGGAGALYSRTDCPLRTTGDGYSLAYRAGARLRDVEFVQFYPLALAEPGAPPFLVGGPAVEEGRIVNALGEDIPTKHGVTARPFATRSRDLLSRAIMLEILGGNGVDGAVLLDAAEVLRRQEGTGGFSRGGYAFLRERLKGAERPLRVAPVSHHCMGGVVVDEHGVTGVPGLYAVGEVAGGVHGANRHGGNALTDTIVFGARVGAAAAEFAKGRRHPPVEGLAEDELRSYEELRSDLGAEGVDPQALMSRLRGVMWLKAGIVRSGGGLAEALREVEALRRAVPRLGASSGRGMLEALEVPMALDAAEMIIRAAQERRESRGAHYRLDHPNTSDDWLRTIVIGSGPGGKMRVSSRPL